MKIARLSRVTPGLFVLICVVFHIREIVAFTESPVFRLRHGWSVEPSSVPRHALQQQDHEPSSGSTASNNGTSIHNAIQSTRGGDMRNGRDVMNDSARGNETNHGESLVITWRGQPVTKFFRLLFQGITLPFPTLRRLILESHPSEHDKDSNSKKSSLSSSQRMAMGFSLKESMIAIAVYLALGAVSYSSTALQKDQRWSLVDALYFGVVTFTSVGYGDLCPTTTGGKLFTILFGLSGISILGIAIGTIGSRFVQQENSMIQAAKDASQRRLLHFLQARMERKDKKRTTSITTSPTTVVKDEMAEGNDTETKTNDVAGVSEPVPPLPFWFSAVRRLFQKSIPAFATLALGGIFMGRLEGWSMIDALYYTFITAGTLGYGDVSPLTRNGRIWAILFVPLAVSAAGEVLGNVASALLDRRHERFQKSLMERELNVDRLVEMDTDHNGMVSREEYVEFMLKEMQLVSEELFQELHQQFDKLDADGGGYLDQNDLKILLNPN